MNSRLSQKLFALMLIISLCFLAACSSEDQSVKLSPGGEGGQQGPGDGSGEGSEEEGGSEESAATTCYAGQKNDQKACVKLITIDGKLEGYLDPRTDPSFMANGNKNQYRIPAKAVNLKIADPNLKIAPNFKLHEFMSLAKGNYGIFSTKVIGFIQKIREQARGAVKINSAYRSPKWNAGIDGSAKWSRHQYGDGVDIASPSASLDKLVQLCRSMGATYVDKYVKHVHCDWRNTTLETSFFGEPNSSQKSLSEEEEHMHTLSDLHDTSEIHVSGNRRSGNILLLTSTVTYKDDTEELWKRWVITAPNGDQIDLEQSEVSLPVSRGTYQVVHYIGENVQLSKTIYVQ